MYENAVIVIYGVDIFLDVDPIQNGTGYLTPIFDDLIIGTSAFGGTVIATGAGVHGCNEHKIRGIDICSVDP